MHDPASLLTFSGGRVTPTSPSHP